MVLHNQWLHIYIGAFSVLAERLVVHVAGLPQRFVVFRSQVHDYIYVFYGVMLFISGFSAHVNACKFFLLN